MKKQGVPIKKSYAFACAKCSGGHISLTTDGRAILVHSPHTDHQLEFRIFIDGRDETADTQARRYVLQNIDEKAEFFEDLYLDLCNWMLQNT